MELYKEVLPLTMMVAFECISIGANTLFKEATNTGMSYNVYLFYSHSLSLLLLLPSLLFYRRSVLPPLTCSIIGKLLLLGLMGGVATLLGYKGIKYGNPTLASVMSNLVPAFTFIFAIIFRMEKLAWRSSTSQAKMVGTMVCITGGIIVIFYKGPSLFVRDSNYVELSSTITSGSWLIAGLLLGAEILNEYPAKLVVVFSGSFVASIIYGATAVIAEPNISAWVLKPDICLTAIVYTGLIGSNLMNLVLAWVVHRKGPFYIAMFKPLSIVIAAIMGVLFLGDVLHLGSIIGSSVITMGFCAVMWGKAEEEAPKDGGFSDLESFSHKTPLLKN